MSGALALAFSTLERLHGPGAAARLVRRCEADDEGELVLTLEIDGVGRWFRTNGGELVEVHPGDDETVPAAAELSALCKSGEARILSWRPGRRIVAQLRDGSGGRILKGWRKKSFGRALAAQHAAEERVLGRAFRVARLLASDPERATLALELLAGRPLDAASVDLAVLTEIGSRIVRLQRTRADDLATHTRNDEIALLVRRAARTRRAGGDLPEGWSDLMGRLEPLASRPALDGVAAHRDLHDGQVLVVGKDLALLDFDLLARAESALDPANLSVHLELRVFESGASEPDEQTRAAVGALLEGLDRQGEPGFRESFAFHVASTALRLALLCALRPAWSGLRGPMLARARVALEECQRA